MECQYRIGDDPKTLTHLIIAPQHSALSKIINMLKYGIKNRLNSNIGSGVDKENKRFSDILGWIGPAKYVIL